MRPPRILFVINSLAGGGAERVLLTLLEASAELAGRAELSLALLDDEPRAYTIPRWLPVHQLDARHSLARSVVQLRKLVRRQRPDLIVSFLTRSNMATTILARLENIPNVISERANTSGHFAPGLKGALSKRMIATIYPRATKVIAVSQGIAADLVENFGVRAQNVVAIPNPLDADRVRAAAGEDLALPVAKPFGVVVSRLTRGKNVITAVEAFARSGLDHSLVIFGEGPERDAIEAHAAARGLADRVVMPGFSQNPFAIMRHADFYLSASNGEGFPNSLVEALALGLPAIATNCASGPSEVLADLPREQVSGLTFAPYGILTDTNDADQLAAAMRAVAEHGARLREAGPRRAAEFGVEQAKKRYWSVFGEALGRPHMLEETGVASAGGAPA